MSDFDLPTPLKMSYQSEPPMPQANRIKCLIVDDIQENLIALEALLQRDDLEILKAESGAQALELLLTHSDVALALLDVQMPEMNGFELAELLRGSERTRQIPLIFMTAGSRDHNWQFRGYESGAVDFLYKPIDPQMLMSKVNVFFDLHRRTQALAHEVQERTAALRINEMFMAVLSHDLRTPLMSMTAAASLLKRAPEPEKVVMLADNLLGCSQRMSRMIEDLLDVTRIRHMGGLALKLGPCNMQSLMQRVVDEVRNSYPGRCIETRLAGDMEGIWDGERLCQVMTNLMGNAIQHGSADMPVTVTVTGGETAHLSFAVSNGGEIPAAVMPSLFDPFRGGDRAPGRHQGLGLGLFIAHQIVRAHGGQLAARSQAGTTQFQMDLPRFTSSGGTRVEV